MTKAEVFGPFELLGQIAQGGMADVQFAVRREVEVSPLFAVKRILPQYSRDQNFRRFFAAEVDLALHLSHPNVVQALDAGEVEGVPFLAMEYIHGRSLGRLLQALRSQGR